MTDELILCIQKKSISQIWLQTECAVKYDEKNIETELKKLDFIYEKRISSENNFSLKQIIPYCLVKDNNGNFACYPRAGTESRLHGLYSLGIGGHININDKANNLMCTIKNGLIREIKEEFKSIKFNHSSLSLLGLINEEYSDVGKMHIGIVFLLEVKDHPPPAEELYGLFWQPEDKINELKLELWSSLAFSLL